MSSTDSDSSNHKRHKSNKKSKRKSEKKHKKQKKEKRQKQRKRSKHESSSSGSESSTEVKVPKIIAAPRDVVLDTDSFGPALPPHLLKRQSEEQLEPVIIGPIIPSHLTSPSVSRKEVSPNINDNTRIEASNDENEDDGTYGPLPVTEGNAPMTAAQIELEQRALELKLAAIEGTSSQPVDQKVREEWMLELPDVGLKGGLAALSNMKRTFHHGKEKPDFSDRSVWTKTPQGENQPQKPSTSKQDVEALRNDAQAIYERQRDEEQERMAKKHKKKHKRDESLVEIHQKKLRKEQKKREKELAASGEKPERRPFSRDVDLKLNKIDKNQTKSIVDKAKILNTKFASGHTKYL